MIDRQRRLTQGTGGTTCPSHRRAAATGSSRPTATSTSRPTCGPTACPTACKDRAPRIESFDEGDAWVIEGVKDPINFGMNACAGLEPEEMQGWGRFEDICARAATTRPRASTRWTATASTPRCCTPRRACRRRSSPTSDAEYHLAMVRAYNDWISEYVESRAGALRRPRDPAQPRRRGRGRRARAGDGPPGHARRGDRLLAQRHARRSSPRTTRSSAALAERGIPLQHPRVA